MHKPTNLENGKRVVVQHGELVLKPIDAMPVGKTKTVTDYAAAHSETGHHHVIEKGELLEKNGERYLLIKETSKLFHKKTYDIHETQYLAPGAYLLDERTEYDPFQKIVRRVFD